MLFHGCCSLVSRWRLTTNKKELEENTLESENTIESLKEVIWTRTELEEKRLDDKDTIESLKEEI